MTDSDKINGWTFEETVKTAENLMEVENNVFKLDVLRHLRDFAEMYEEEVQRFRALGTVEELRHAKEKQIPTKPIFTEDKQFALCPCCDMKGLADKQNYCNDCGQKLDWSDDD